jgi:glycosyltransferase involved in cell wall biosynthesis
LAAPNGAEDLGYIPPPHRDGNELSVGYVGHLYEGRGTDLIFKLASACPWAQFHIVGGADEDIKQWQGRSAQLQNLHLHGFIPPSRVEEFRRRCDVLLAPYQREVYSSSFRNQASYMSPLKLFEYMASGRAIICSDLPVLHEILTHGETALFCSPEDVNNWIEALEKLRGNPELRWTLGTNARARFMSSFTRGSRVVKILRWEALGKRPTGIEGTQDVMMASR